MDSEPIDANVTTTNSAAYASSYANVSTQKRRDNFADAGETSNNLKQSIKRKMDSLTLETVQQCFGTPNDKAVQILGVSRSTLKRFCREHCIPRWPVSKLSKQLSQKSWPERYAQRSSSLRIHLVVFLLVRVKRWSCSSRQHDFSRRWWICDKHSSHPSKSRLSIYQIINLVVRLRRWRNKSSSHAQLAINIPNSYPYGPQQHLDVDIPSTPDMEHRTSTQNTNCYAAQHHSDADFFSSQDWSEVNVSDMESLWSDMEHTTNILIPNVGWKWHM